MIFGTKHILRHNIAQYIIVAAQKVIALICVLCVTNFVSFMCGLLRNWSLNCIQTILKDVSVDGIDYILFCELNMNKLSIRRSRLIAFTH